MEVFRSCAEQGRRNGIWAATTGPAFMEALLSRTDLRIVRSKADAHPGTHGAYLNACSLFAAVTGRSPVGLPATLKLADRKKKEYVVAPGEAKYLQELAWTVYRREIKHVRPEEKSREGR
jgi:hypothetical protein